MGLKIFINGRMLEKEKANVSVFDHGFLYGDGVFEGIRSYDGLVFKLKEHIDRLFESAHTIMLKVPYTREEFIGLILKTLKINIQNKLKNKNKHSQNKHAKQTVAKKRFNLL